MSEPVLQYVSKKVFDEVYQELQAIKSAPQRLAVVSFNEVYDVGVLHDRIRELEAEVETLKAIYQHGRE